MKLEHEDPRVIDYVLGELPEDERHAVEQALLDDDTGNAAFRDEMHALTALAKETLAAEAGVSPRAGTISDTRTVSFDANKSASRRFAMGALRIAATVTLIGLLGLVFLPTFSRAREAARIDSPENRQRMAELQQKMEAEEAAQSALEAKVNRHSGAPATAAAAPPSPAIMPAPQKPQTNPEPARPAHNLQNVEVGGGIRIQGDWYEAGKTQAGSNSAWNEQRTRVNFKSDPKDHESEELKMDGYENWGSSFRSDYLTGFDSAGGPAVDVQKAVKEANEINELKKLAQNTPSSPAAIVPGQVAGQLSALGYSPDDSVVPKDSRAADQSNYQNEAGKAFQPVVPLTFKSVAAEPLSTFAADVDTASYTFVKRMLQGNSLPSPAMVRPEEFINYFDYAYPQPVGEHPFSVTVDIAGCPWAPEHQLARVGIRGKAMDAKERAAANLVFLVDVSGSMDSPDKLPLVRESLKALLSTLKASDRVGIVTYAGESRVALPPTSCEKKAEIAAAIDSLRSGGSTNGAQGIYTAYELAKQGLLPGGINRVLIATDGDFNVGVTSQEGLLELITKEAKSGVFLSVLGYGMGNLMDSTLEMLADKGNGFYAYISDVAEARRVLVDKGLSAIATIAKDVKFQLEFNPAKVAYYRQIGYENRQLAAQDFNDDTKDAGDIGPDHRVTALYELVPVGQTPTPGVDPLKYQAAKPTPVPANDSPETMTVKLRYKEPEAQTSKLLEVPVSDSGTSFESAPQDFRFAAAVAAFAEKLKRLQVSAPLSMDQIQAMAEAAKGTDPARQEFVDLVVTTKTMAK